MSVVVPAYASHEYEAGASKSGNVLVFPAASRPSINSRISLDPKILAIILDIEPPILSVVCGVAG